MSLSEEEEERLLDRLHHLIPVAADVQIAVAEVSTCKMVYITIYAFSLRN